MKLLKLTNDDQNRLDQIKKAMPNFNFDTVNDYILNSKY